MSSQQRFAEGKKIRTEAWLKGMNKEGQYEDIPMATKAHLQEASKKGEIDVLVVGGGASGTLAWTTLNAGKAKAWMVEATDRLGGGVDSIGVEKGNQVHRFDIGDQFVGRSHRAVYSLANAIYPQFAMGEDNTKGMKDVTKRKNAKGHAVETINGVQYTYKFKEIPDAPVSAHVAPVAGLPTPLPTQLNKLRDIMPFNAAKNLMTLILGIMNMGDLFYNSVQDPKKKYPNTIVPYLKQLDQITLEDWLQEQNYLSDNVRDLIRLAGCSPSAIEPEKISMLSFLEFCKANGSMRYMMNKRQWGPQQYMLKSSFQTLINTVAMEKVNEGRMVLNAKVVKIEYEKAGEGYVEGAKVTFEDGSEIKVKQVIIAMSPILAMKNIKMNQLGEKYHHFLTQRVMGERMKLHFMYNKAFWREGETEYMGYTGRWGHTKKMKKKYRNTKDKPPYVINTYDASYDMEEIYILTAVIQGKELSKLRNKKGEVDMDRAKEACIQHFYEAYGRDPLSAEDKELVEGSNLEATFGGVWDKHSLASGAATLFKPKTQTQYEEFLYENQGCDNHGNKLPVYFSSSSFGSFFQGHLTGSVTSGATIALQVLSYLKEHTSQAIDDKPQPFESLATTEAMYQQFEPCEMDDGNVRSFPFGFIDYNPPQILNFGNVVKYTAQLKNLDIKDPEEEQSIDQFEAIDIVNSLDYAISGVPNPGLNKEEFAKMSFLDKAIMTTNFSDYGNIVGFFQMMQEDIVLVSKGPEAYKKYIPFIGKWKGTNPLDPNGLVGFFIGTTCINAWDAPRKIYQDPNDPTHITLIGPSLMVPPGFEADRNRGKEGTDWNDVQTVVEYHFSRKTGYVEYMNVYSDNMSVFQLLKNNNIIPSDA